MIPISSSEDSCPNPNNDSSTLTLDSNAQLQLSESSALPKWNSLPEYPSSQQVKETDCKETLLSLPWTIHSVAYEEFLSVKRLCEESPFVFMRKDNLHVYFKLKYGISGFTSITTSQAYQYLPSTRIFIYSNIHFIYFTWKLNELRRTPPPSLVNRLRYITFPATYPIGMLKAMYFTLYDDHLTNKEFYQVCCQAFGKPQALSIKDTSGAPKFALSNDAFKDSMTWSEFIASGSSMDMSNVKNSPNDFIALDNSSAFISNSSLNYYSSDSETVYSSESDMDISFSPPKKRHEAGKRPTSSLAVTLSNSKYSKRLRYTQNITRKEHAHKYEAEQSYSSRYFHTPSTALTTSTSKSFCSESSPSLPPPLPTTLLSTQCTISTRELLNYLKEVFLSSMSVEYLDSNCSIANDKGLHSDPVGKLGKDLSQIVVAPSTFDSCVIHASHFF